MRKKKVLFVSNYPAMKTGFGGFVREILDFLYRKDAYELAVLGAGVPFKGHPDFIRFPYQCYGTIPAHLPEEMQRMQQDPAYARDVNYGRWAIDEVLKEFKPDLVIFSEDSWQTSPWFESKKWWNKIPTIIHTTIDSEPLLEDAIKLAKGTNYFYTWSDFAPPLFHKKGSTHVKALHGTIDTKTYCKLSSEIKKQLRQKHNISPTDFIVGMVFRNQTRKQVHSLIEGHVEFQKNNPQVKSKLLLVTSLEEGWRISKLAEERGANKDDILYVYKCRKTQNYFILPDKGQGIDNPVTEDTGCLFTTNITDGITNEQLNEVYNLMDCYAHVFNSGGMERPIFEAKLCELPTLVTNYSCGEDLCIPNIGTFALEYSTSLEFGTEFIKANTYPSSIAKQLKKVVNLDNREKSEQCKNGRKWVIENYSIESVGNKFAELIDSIPEYTGQWNFWESRVANLNAEPTKPIGNARDLVDFAYRDILNWHPDEIDLEREDLKQWVKNLEGGMPPQQFLEVIRKAGAEHNAKLPNNITPEKYLRDLGVKENAVLVVFKESGGDVVLITSLFRSLREQYPNNQLVVSVEPRFAELLLGNLNIDLVIPFQSWMDQQLILQGIGANKPLVFKSLHLRAGTQQNLDYLGADKINLNLKY